MTRDSALPNRVVQVSNSSAGSPAYPTTTVEGGGGTAWQYRLRGVTPTPAAAARATSSPSERRGRVSRKCSPAPCPDRDAPGMAPRAWRLSVA